MKYAILSGYIQRRFKNGTISLTVNSRKMYNISKRWPNITVKRINSQLFAIEKK